MLNKALDGQASVLWLCIAMALASGSVLLHASWSIEPFLDRHDSRSVEQRALLAKVATSTAQTRAGKFATKMTATCHDSLDGLVEVNRSVLAFLRLAISVLLIVFFLGVAIRRIPATPKL